MHDDRSPRGQRETETNHKHWDDGKRSITEVVRIAGKIEANLPPDFVEKYHTSNEKDGTRESKRFIVEIITLVVVLVVAGFGAIQTRQAIRAAKASETANNLASSNFRAGQRAWVGLDITDKSNPIVIGDVGHDTIAVVHFKNYGNSPALHLLLHGAIRAIPAHPDWGEVQRVIDNLDMSKEGAQESTLFNGQVAPDFTRAKPPISFADAQEIELGRVRIIVGERITYDDIFGKSHETTICLQYTPNHAEDVPSTERGHWASCPINEKAT
jgi:hypothetical protein